MEPPRQFTIDPSDLDTPLTKCVAVEISDEPQFGYRVKIWARDKNAGGKLGVLRWRRVTISRELADDKPALLEILRKKVDLQPKGPPPPLPARPSPPSLVG